MSHNPFQFTDHDDVSIHVECWVPRGEVVAAVQIAHGMQEYALRYENVARALTEKGFAVYANDHRGHGRSLIEPQRLGHLGSGGTESVLKDMKQLSDIIVERHPGKPLFLVGHSWGSFLSQAYAQRWGKALSGLVLSGSNGKNPLVKIGVYVSRLVAALRGADRTAGLLDALSVGGLNKQFEPGQTGLEWLSRDPSVVKAYVDDPLCGAPFPNSFFVEMTALLASAWAAENEALIPADLPVRMISGDRDPVGLNGTGVEALARRYRERGMTEVSVKLYPMARHEVFNETNREEVLDDLVAWLSAHL